MSATSVRFSTSPTSVQAAFDHLIDLQSFGAVHLAIETGPLAMGLYAAVRTSPQLIFCLDGVAHYWVRRNGSPMPVTLRAGDAIVLPGGTWIALDPQEPYRNLGISIFPEMLHCYLVQPGRPGEPHPTHGVSRSYEALSDNILVPPPDFSAGGFERTDYLDELDRPRIPDLTCDQLVQVLAMNGWREPADPLLNHLLKGLLLRLRECATTAQSQTTSKAEATFHRIRRYVIANCDKPIDRDTIAAAVGVHSRHVSNLFRRFGSNETLSQFLLRARLERARQLLIISNSPIGEVGQLCGFQAASHFVRAFRDRFGTSPARFRSSVARDDFGHR